MEIQLYKALLGAGVKEQDATAVVDSFERELRDRLGEARKELATRADIGEVRREIAESKAEIIKWNLGAIIAAAGLATAIAKFV